MEIDSKLIICAAAGKDLINRVLGPTADYWGEGLRDINSKIVNNIKRICTRAEKKVRRRNQ